MIKACTKCHIEKDLTEFHFNPTARDRKQSWCIQCVHDFYIEHQEDIKAKARNRFHLLKDQLTEKQRQWRKNNPDKVKAQLRRQRKRRMAFPKNRINHAIGSAIRRCLNGSKESHWEDALGYKIDDLVKHLKRQFKDGMTLENYGSVWEIDHIIPIVAFNFQTEKDIDFKRCWALSNLRPLGCFENNSKNAKLFKPFQPCLQLAVNQ